MSVRPVKLVSSGNAFAIPARLSLITVPTLSMLSTSSGASSITARSQNERTTDASDVSISTTKHSDSELLPAEYSRNSEERPTMAAPDSHAPERAT